jgi:hypothetical protein
LKVERSGKFSLRSGREQDFVSIKHTLSGTVVELEMLE